MPQIQILNRGLDVALEGSQDWEVRYASAEEALRDNPACCAVVDPRESAAILPAYGFPSRENLANKLATDPYWIVEVRLQARVGGGEPYYISAVALDRCGEILRRGPGFGEIRG